MSNEREHWSDHMSVREGRDIVRYIGRDEHGRPERFDTLDYGPTAAEMNAYRREVKARLRRMANPETLRLWLKSDLSSSGHTLEGALATVKRGRRAVADRPRYDALAIGVARLRQRATLKAIGAAIGKEAREVANLEARGREVLKAEADREAECSEPKPCRKHGMFQAECPACLRNAPGRALRYDGVEAADRGCLGLSPPSSAIQPKTSP